MLLAIVGMLTGYSIISYRNAVPVLAAEGALPTAADLQTPDVHLPWPSYGEAAIGAEGYGVLATHGSDNALPTASVAKVMTALAVLKKFPLAPGQQGPTITLTQADVNSFGTYLDEDGSVVKVVKGEKITEYQALEAMLLPSANNMADTLARWAFGSMGDYSAYANGLAKSFGMDDSRFGTADASGFSPQSVASAHDLVLLGETALQNPVLAQIVSKKSAKVPVAGVIDNVNWLLGSDAIDGIKTGSNDADGGVYLFSARQKLASGQTVHVVGAIMGSKLLVQAMNGAVPLLQSVAANFKMSTVVQAGQIVGQYDIPWGGSVEAKAAKSLSLITWHGENLTPKVSLQPFRAPLAKGATVGTAAIAGQPTQTAPVIINQAIPAPTWHWRVLHNF
jgi:D-alanyl-D-alanine carboxypeptidase (penicillin-binding protein 5/6)